VFNHTQDITYLKSIVKIAMSKFIKKLMQLQMKQKVQKKLIETLEEELNAINLTDKQLTLFKLGTFKAGDAFGERALTSKDEKRRYTLMTEKIT